VRCVRVHNSGLSGVRRARANRTHSGLVICSGCCIVVQGGPSRAASHADWRLRERRCGCYRTSTPLPHFSPGIDASWQSSGLADVPATRSSCGQPCVSTSNNSNRGWRCAKPSFDGYSSCAVNKCNVPARCDRTLFIRVFVLRNGGWTDPAYWCRTGAH
jgi:hypothetical protein